jgi:hypothetical protein
MRRTGTDGDTVVREAQAEFPLLRLAEIAEELGSERVCEEATALAQRAREGRFYVACLGQFKRGKSTLLNALLSDRMLPAGVLPLTTVPTVVRPGGSRGARVRFEGGKWMTIRPEDLPQFVSEELNPENKKGVVGVEAFSPSPLLAQGMCLVDTPGLGSVFEGNTTATQAFVPHIDAAIVVVGADPPISGEEVALLRKVGKQVRDLLIVMNKADRTTEEERRAARSFTAKMVEQNLGRPIGPIYEVSAEERLTGRGPERDWGRLIAALQKLVAESGRELVRSAAERGFTRLREELLAIISEEREALSRPIEESELRIQNLRQTISDAERSLRDINYLFMAEEHHLSDMFLKQRKEFLAAVRPKVNADFEKGLKTLPRHYGPKFRREAFHLGQVLAEQYVQPWLESEQAAAEEGYRKVAARFMSIGNDFLNKLAASGAPEFTRMPNALDSERGFRVPSRFTFEQLLHVALPASPLRYLADVFLGFIQAYAVIQKQAWEFLAHLLEMNSTRVQSDVVNRVQESRGQLEVEIRKLLHEVTRVAEHALDRARIAKSEGAPAVEAAVLRLDQVDRALRSLRESSERSAAIPPNGWAIRQGESA